MVAMTLTVLDDREVDGSFMSSEECCCKELAIVKPDDCGGRSARRGHQVQGRQAEPPSRVAVTRSCQRAAPFAGGFSVQVRLIHINMRRPPSQPVSTEDPQATPSWDKPHQRRTTLVHPLSAPPPMPSARRLAA